MLSKSLYHLFLALYSLGIRLVSAWNPKARKWIDGRRDIFTTIRSQLLASHSRLTPRGSTTWMHCASLGEFEQGRPLLEQIRAKHPEQKIVLTFFSPSGYEVTRHEPVADHIFYLPMDSPAHAKQFLDLVNPTLVLWVKYEYWYYYLTEIKQRNIPLLLVSGIFRPRQPFFTWYGGIWKKMLQSFTHFFVQNQESKILLEGLGHTGNVTINGDTRFDRVLEIAENFQPVPHIETFCGNSPVVVAGSTWDEDEIELLHFVKVHPQVKFIMAPHEIDESRLKEIKAEFPGSLFYSALATEIPGEQISNAPQTALNGQSSTNVLVIDNIGMLSRLYRYAHVTYVGGGFGADGVHNVLEAAVYGKPVVFGPVYEKFDEAVGLLDAGGAVSVDGPVPLEQALNNLLHNEEARKKTGDAARKFVQDHAGASQSIVRFIQEKRLLTSR